MICGACTPVFYYGFLCPGFEFYQILYISQCWMFSFVALYVALKPQKKIEDNQGILTAAFIIAGYSVLPGLIHLQYFMDKD